MFQIDYVFPYVNPSDQKWQNIYKYCRGEPFKEDDQRFRDFSLLKYIFRSIETYAPWISKVHLLVQSESQVPAFLKKNHPDLNIVEHKQFIDPEHLPTFNSNTIEMFLPDVQGLPEHFLYANDDFMFFNACTATDFFTKDGRPKYLYRNRFKKNPKEFLGLCKREFELIYYRYSSQKLDHFKKQFHGSAAPFLLSDCIACQNDFKDEIKDSLTMFRNHNLNLNQYIYGYYSLANNHTASGLLEETGSYFSRDDFETDVGFLNALKNCNTKMTCINDTAQMTEQLYGKIISFLDQKFPKKSSFEV